MQTIALPKSSAQEEQAIAQSWKAIIDIALHFKGVGAGRGCVVYDIKTDTSGFLSLFNIQQAGAEALEMKPDIFAQILELAGSGYDYATEVLLLIKSEDCDQIRYKIEIAALDYESWRVIPEFMNVRQRVQIEQQLAARLERLKMKAKRAPKKKGKRKK